MKPEMVVTIEEAEELLEFFEGMQTKLDKLRSKLKGTEYEELCECTYENSIIAIEGMKEKIKAAKEQ